MPDRDLILVLTPTKRGGNSNGAEWLVKNHKRSDRCRASRSTRAAAAACARRQVPLCSEVQASEKAFTGLSRSREESRRPQLRAAPGQRDLPARRRPGETAALRVSGRAQRRDARVLSAHGGHRGDRMPSCGRHARACSKQRSRCRRSGHAVARSALQLDDAHDVRRDPAARRSCRQRAAADRDGEHQLPRPSRRTHSTPCARSSSACSRTRSIAVHRRRGHPTARRHRRSRRSCMDPIRTLTDRMFDKVPVIPFMSTGATDGRYLRDGGIPTYGVSGMFAEPSDSSRARQGRARAPEVALRLPGVPVRAREDAVVGETGGVAVLSARRVPGVATERRS